MFPSIVPPAPSGSFTFEEVSTPALAPVPAQLIVEPPAEATVEPPTQVEPEVQGQPVMDYYSQLLAETRPKKSADVEPLLGPPVLMSSPATTPSTTTEFYTPSTDMSFIPGPPPISLDFASAPAGPVTSIATAPEIEKDSFSGFISPPDRPSAPSPMDPSEPLSSKEAQEARDLIREAKQFLETHQPSAPESSSFPHPDDCKNIIDCADAEQHLEGVFEKFNIAHEGLTLGPVGKRVKDNIISVWRQEFCTMDTAEIEVSPVIDSEPDRRAISTCAACGFIIDVVEFIRETTNGEMYDGSSLEQLQRKLSLTKVNCPRCGAHCEFNDPMLGVASVPVVLGGTVAGALNEDGARIEDPTLYKLAPSSVMQNQMQLKDPMDELAKMQDRVEEVDDTKDECQDATAEEKGKEEMEEVPTPTGELEEEVVASSSGTDVEFSHYLSGTAVNQLASATENFGGSVASITSVWKSQIGRVHQGLTFLYDAHNLTELCVLSAVDQVERTEGEKVPVFTREDQYLKRTKPHQLSPETDFSHAAAGHLLVQCLNFLARLFHQHDIVVREQLPCEGRNETDVTWNLESKLFSRHRKCKLPLGQVFTHGKDRIGCRFYAETLLYYVFLSAQRQDETREHIWSRFPKAVAPWDCIVAANDSSSGGHLKKYAQTLMGVGFSVKIEHGTLEELIERADVLGIPFLITLVDAEKTESVFEVSARIRARDSQRSMKSSILDIAVALETFQ